MSGGKGGLALAGAVSVIVGGCVGALLAWLADVSWLLAALVALGCLFLFYMEGAYRVWDKADKATQAALTQVEAQKAELAAGKPPTITMIGGAGGSGYHAGGGGGVAGPGGYAEGGKGGEGFSLLEAFAFSAVGTGLPLDLFVRQAGYSPDSPELRQRFGGGGAGGGAGIAPTETGAGHHDKSGV
jgi:hypothetical protein